MEPIKFAELPLYDLGNNIEIGGMILQGQGKTFAVMFPKSELNQPQLVQVNDDEWKKLLFQLDTLEAVLFPGKKDTAKVVVRKSQRNIEQGINWRVFHRDGYTCRYCGATGGEAPMTVDHIVLWEDMGASVEDNLNSACRKCNKERGNMQYDEWLKSDYYKKVSANIASIVKLQNENCWQIAQAVPLRVANRSR